jgi:exopolyphosphatase/guanosine-5'-triphosphate,3'-diphosphate pyrophosphatase
VQHALPDLAGQPYIVVDVGGGSSEHIVTDGTRVVSAVSVPIGARRLTERHLASDPPSFDEIGALYADIDSRLATLELPAGVPIVGTAGTATSLAAMELGLAKYDPDRVTGHVITPQRLQARLDSLLGMTVAARKGIVGLEPQRADVIAAGVAILARLVKRVGAPRFVACDRGIRWGIAYEQLAPR